MNRTIGRKPRRLTTAAAAWPWWCRSRRAATMGVARRAPDRPTRAARARPEPRPRARRRFPRAARHRGVRGRQGRHPGGLVRGRDGRRAARHHHARAADAGAVVPAGVLPRPGRGQRRGARHRPAGEVERATTTTRCSRLTRARSSPRCSSTSSTPPASGSSSPWTSPAVRLARSCCPQDGLGGRGRRGWHDAARQAVPVALGGWRTTAEHNRTGAELDQISRGSSRWAPSGLARLTA